jgi:hypothetical protein
MMMLSPAITPQDLGAGRETKVDTPELIQAARDVLLQGLGLLFELGDRSYARSAGAPFHAAISGHYCRVLENFQALVRGSRPGEINYNVLEANARLQDDVRYASVATCDVLRALKPYTEERLSRNCQVTNTVGYGPSKPAPVDSNIARELAYCIGQAIHHYAIIRLIGQQFGIAVPAEFGVTPSKQKAAVAS